MFETFQLGIGETYLKIYDGGSGKDENIFSETGNSVPDPLISFRSQMFIMFTTDGNGDCYGFTAKIIFGIRTNC